MSRVLPRLDFVAWMGGLAFCSLATVSLSGCGDKTATNGKGGSKFQVASDSGDGKKSADEGGAAEPGNGDGEKKPSAPLFKPKKEDNGEPAQPPVLASEKLGDYRVPDGEPEEIHAFMQQLESRRPRGRSEAEMLADYIKIQRARVAAADKLFGMKGVVKEVRREAVTTKIQALNELMERGNKEAYDEFTTFIATLAKDKEPELSRMGRLIAYNLETVTLAQQVKAENADAKPLVARLKKLLAEEEQDKELLDFCEQTAMVLEQLEQTELAAEAYRAIGEAFATSKDIDVARKGQSLLDQAVLTEVDFLAKLQAAATDKPDSLAPLMEAITKVLSGEKLGATAFEQTSQAASIMEFTGHYKESSKILELVGKAFKDNPEEKIVKVAAEAVANGGKRLGLVGKPFVVEGDLLDGSKFDWSKYKGKVVLLDFWATWCGPCIREIPNIKRNYEKYKDKGFEVIGINCDDEKMAVERFFAGQELPWPNIHSTDPEALGMQNPLAQKCGVDAIPFLVLINAEGNVEAIHVHGEALGEKLAAIFGEKTEKPAAETGRKGPPPKKSVDGKTGYFTPARESNEFTGPTYFVALADEEPKAEEEANPYLADEGLTPNELVTFILRMEDKPKSIQKRPGFGDAIVDAADRILAAQPAADNKLQIIAIESKLISLHKRACLGDEKCDKTLAAFVESLKDDTRERVAREVKFFQLEREVMEADKLALDKLPELFAKLKEFYAKEALIDKHLRIASSTVALVNRLEDGDAREKEFKEFGTLLAKSGDKKLSAYGKKLAKAPGQSESKLVGQPLELAGNTTEGQPFKWAAYRGKVVIVDFWATWCGPCRREMPHVKELYEKHKAKGFDVVGISLDKDLDALADYIAENAIPWTNLSGEETQDLATKYGVRGIPTMMLIDKDGKIIAVSHNVGALTAQLEKLLTAPAADK